MMASKPNEISDLSDVILQSDQVGKNEQSDKIRKRPNQVLHFCDGDLEVYSEDETDATKDLKTVADVDPKSLNWLPWTWHQTARVSMKILNGCDYVGECLATFFGITSPKYQFEIDEFYRQQEMNKEIQHREDLEMGGWNEESRNNCINVDKSPINNPTLL